MGHLCCVLNEPPSTNHRKHRSSKHRCRKETWLKHRLRAIHKLVSQGGGPPGGCRTSLPRKHRLLKADSKQKNFAFGGRFFGLTLRFPRHQVQETWDTQHHTSGILGPVERMESGHQPFFFQLPIYVGRTLPLKKGYKGPRTPSRKWPMDFADPIAPMRDRSL